ncbi:protein NUCLEAR FUSION DEFECTIVE 4-like [Oryza brachyantha]|nr:protein NUCLEAR FUSION DEFECTIVE 4-like [Oryza brachyantha]
MAGGGGGAGKVKAGSRPPWVGLAAAVWVQMAAGSAYVFPLYSHAIKEALGYNQKAITMLGVANDIGENVGLVPGVLANRLPPWFILVVGSACALLGFGTLWLAVTKTLVMPYWVLCIALCIGTNSSAWLGTAALVTNMRNFPLSRGTVAGLIKGYVAVSAAVYTETFNGMLQNSPTNLLLLLALGIPTACVLVMYFVRPCTPSLDEDNAAEHSHFIFTQISSVVLGVYLMVATILGDTLKLSDTITYILFGIMILLLLAPLAIPIKMTLYPNKPKREKTSTLSPSYSTDSLSGPDQENSEPLLGVTSTYVTGANDSDEATDVDLLLAEGEGAVNLKKRRGPRRGDDFTFLEALVKADFWLLFIVYFCGVGTGVTVLNNLAQVGMAVGADDTTILLCLFGFCNFVGRILGGSISEYFVRSRMLPRPFWMMCTQIIMVITFLLFATGLHSLIYVSTTLLGLCYGVQFAVMIPTVSELFGLKDFGLMYNFMLLVNPLGAFFFSALLAGYIYDKEAARQHPGVLEPSTCLGPDCFRLTFYICAFVCCCGTLVSVFFIARIKPVYQMLYASGSFRHPRSQQQLH